jgi:mRNA interferase HigB
MNIISVRILREFIKKHPQSQTPLMRWYKTVQKSDYKTPQEMILDFAGSDYVGNDRIVFNTGHNKYRLIVSFDYDRDVGFIKFIGTHKEYDKIDAKTVAYKKFTQ